ncbi:MAG: peptidylprolyl isomerase [Deltaproteobacteria bacterium]|nr:peptidylprolyl isomerase [Deltaproteobacteria bacterium]MBN2846513.1 peptidylprolyl isomerase [Deltaproteobacteria bacterium]
MADEIQRGDTISVNYTGTFESGEVFDSSEGNPPLKFTVGAGQLIKGFDDAVVGMKKGDKKSVTISPENAYGERRDDHVVDFPRANIPEDMEMTVDMVVQLSDESGRAFPAVVTEVTDDTVKMDVNHPLAGKTLIFDIEIAETGLESDIPGCGGSCSSCNMC